VITQERRTALRRTYLSLGVGELVAAGVFALIAIGVVAPRFPKADVQLAVWAALAPLLVVLIEAGIYWLSARRWVGIGSMPARLARVYRRLRVATALLLALGLGGMLASWPTEPAVAVLVVATWMFAVVEYVNYFVVRLSYPARRWWSSVVRWRTPRLMKDVRAGGSTT